MKPKNPNAPNVKHGFAFEKITDAAFEPLMKQHRCTWERVVDAKDAFGSMLAAECDFRLRVPSGTHGAPYVFNIECKASLIHDTLSQGFRQLLRKGQVPLARMAEWVGCCTLYFFHSVRNDEIEIWRGRDFYDAYYVSRLKVLTQPVVIIPRSAYDRTAREIVTDPARFINTVYNGITP